MGAAMPPQVQLGVFFTLKGASGFPKRDAKSGVAAAGDAFLTQLLHFSRTQVPVVDLDLDHIRQLTVPGMLLEILEERVEALGMQSGKPPHSEHPTEASALPDHLADL